MGSTLSEIESALAIVQRTLDTLSARGDHEAAFELARAQYAASIRTSWPHNLAKVALALRAVADNESLKLQPEEREQIRYAVSTFMVLVDQ